MLRVLTLATLFPNACRPVLGGFVARQARALAARPQVALEVVAPVGLPAWPLALHPHYAPLRRLADEEEWQGLPVHRPRFRVWPGIGQARAAADLADALAPRLRRLRARFPFDVIDAQYFWPDGPAAMRLARALDLPFSIKARGSDILCWAKRPGIGEQILEAAEAAGGLLAVSDALKRDMIALGLPERKIRVHRTGIDLDRFVAADKAAAKAALDLTGPVIATVGALIPRKGQRFAIEAAARLPGATLLLVGDGPDRRALERLAAACGGDVRFLGARAHADLPGLLAAADVMLLPTNAEGLANAWVEALACGTPVVTCDVGGAREALDRPEAGRIVEREPEALAAAVREILAEPPEPAAVRAAAERFSWDRNAEELEAHLRAVAALGGSAAARAA